MWLRLIIGIILISVNSKTVYAFSCFNCNAFDQKGCNLTQHTMLCKTNEQQCMTITFSKYKMLGENKYLSTNFVRKCVKTDGSCQKYCDAITGPDAKCSVACCKSNLCNNFKEDYKSMVSFSNSLSLIPYPHLTLKICILLLLLSMFY